MYKTLSGIQKKHFLEISGKEFKEENRGSFHTDRPFNNDNYNYSPYHFSYIFDTEKGYFVCEMAHKMTNNQVFGWDYKGNDLSKEILSEYFQSDGLGFNIV